MPQIFPQTFLGIDIGGTSVKAAVNFAGQWTHLGQSDFYARPDTDRLRAAIRQAAGPVWDAAAIGLCVPGLMNADRTQIALAVNVPGLMNLALAGLVPSALGWTGTRPVIIANDAGATAHDLYGRRKLTGRLLLLTLGTGVGSVVLDDGGKVLNVEGGTSGHLGQIDVSIPGHGAIGPDGGAGGLEGYIGVGALRQAYGPDVSAAVSKFNGSEPALLALVRAVRIAHAIYRPHHVCLAGGIGIRLNHLLPTLKGMIDHQLTSVARQDYTFTCGDDDFHAARGAAMLAGQATEIA
jgi:predicted NBD/HSP70 family sugar kinase